MRVGEILAALEQASARFAQYRLIAGQKQAFCPEARTSRMRTLSLETTAGHILCTPKSCVAGNDPKGTKVPIIADEPHLFSIGANFSIGSFMSTL